MERKKYLLITLFSMVCSWAFAQSIAPFKSGDRVVFAGNSITESGLYGNDIWLYYITRFPERKLRVFNGGIGGDIARNILDRLDGDLLDKDPTALVVTFGMNDTRYYEYGDTTKTEEVIREAVATSKGSFDQIVEKLRQQPQVRKIIMSSSPYDETMENKDNYFPGKSIAMERIAAFQQEAARANSWDFVDLLHPMTAINLREQARQPDFTLIGPDRIHPGSAGHLVMAYFFLKTQGLANQPVADVVLDAQQGRVIEANNATIRSVKANNGELIFNYLAKALPFPIDTVPRVWQNFQTQPEALEVIPFMQEFNQERIAVTGLDAGHYALLIDGQHILDASSDELATGINLAEYQHTPQYQQAYRLMDLNRQHRELEHKYRNYYWVHYNFLKEKGLLHDDSDAARDTARAHAETNGWLNAKMEDFETVRVKASRKKLDKQMASIRKQLYRLNKPTSHRITIRRY